MSRGETGKRLRHRKPERAYLRVGYAKKYASNLAMHQVSFYDAATAFGDPLSATIGDPDHSGTPEQIFLLIGQTSSGRVIVVVHVERGENRLRLISARPATRRELRDYEQE